jgi:hypothetical protein
MFVYFEGHDQECTILDQAGQAELRNNVRERVRCHAARRIAGKSGSLTFDDTPSP